MSVRVLIVENNTTTLRHLSRVVSEAFNDELHIELVEDFESAQKLLDQPPAFDLMLIDLALPDNQGIRLLEQASKASHEKTPGRSQVFSSPSGGLAQSDRSGGAHQTADALRVATTLTEDDELLFPAIKQGACAYLLKENRFEVLVEELQKIARGQTPLSPALARRLLAHFKNPAHCDLSGPGALTTLGLEALAHFSQGFTLKETAQRMGMKEFAVCDLVQQTYQKFQKKGA